ncbi:MAG: universal stress protein [Vicinamibacterales bacterium]
MFTRILVATDFSAPSDAALVYAKAVAAQFGASLHLLHVVENPVIAGMMGAEVLVPDTSAMVAALEQEAETKLSAMLAPAERTKFRATTEIRMGSAASTIVEMAHSLGVDLLVMGTHGRTGVTHALLGSVAERVTRHSTCPVLTVHATPEPVREAAAFPAVATA